MKQIHNSFKENTEYFYRLLDWLQTNGWIEYTCPFTGDSMIGSPDLSDDGYGSLMPKYIINLTKGWIKHNYLDLPKINILREAIGKIKEYYTISDFLDKHLYTNDTTN